MGNLKENIFIKKMSTYKQTHPDFGKW